jgi:hypothetical protein
MASGAMNRCYGCVLAACVNFALAGLIAYQKVCEEVERNATLLVELQRRCLSCPAPLRQGLGSFEHHDFVDEVESKGLLAEIADRDDALKVQLVKHIPCAHEDIAPDYRPDGNLGDSEQWNVEAITPHAEGCEPTRRRAMQLFDYAGREDVHASARIKDYVRRKCST